MEFQGPRIPFIPEGETTPPSDPNWLRNSTIQRAAEIEAAAAKKDEAAANVFDGTIERRRNVTPVVPVPPPQRPKPRGRDAWGIGAGLPTGDLDDE